MEKQASDLFKEFKELTPSEFFRKNRQMLGFSGKIRSLTMVFHELITNSLDAAEEAGILPNIEIELERIDKDYYVLRHQDNGPGIPEDYVPKVFCKMFAGSKFRNIQSRGQQGLGCSGCVLFSQMTTGKPVRVISKYKEDGEIKGVEMLLQLDEKKNEGVILEKNEVDPDGTGVFVELHLKDVTYSRSEQGAFEYIRRTMIGNPHAQITFKDPRGKIYKFKRASTKIPPLPKEIPPHPKGITADDLLYMAKHSNRRKIKTFLMASLSRMSQNKIKELEKLVNVDLDKRPKDLKWDEAEEIVNAFKKMDFMSPPTSGLIPIGESQIEKSMKKMLNPEFVASTTRKPATYKGGIPFITEAAIAYGGNAGRKVGDQRKSEIIRFANRVPLTFDQGSCAITEAVKSIDWKRYGVRDFENSPISVFVNIVSTNVPYLSTGKQSIAPEPEILHEVRQAVMDVARKLRRYLRSKAIAREELQKYRLFKKYIPIIIKEAAKLAETSTPNYNNFLKKIVEKRNIPGEINEK